jgi:hypothetical protein
MLGAVEMMSEIAQVAGSFTATKVSGYTKRASQFIASQSHHQAVAYIAMHNSITGIRLTHNLKWHGLQSQLGIMAMSECTTQRCQASRSQTPTARTQHRSLRNRACPFTNRGNTETAAILAGLTPPVHYGRTDWTCFYLPRTCPSAIKAMLWDATWCSGLCAMSVGARPKVITTAGDTGLLSSG